ncbi:MAG: hypothetical protein MK116_00500 [Phycisphaerales bacterium]|nr:hypothetical protein [Phycisphaerales bacterium]
MAHLILAVSLALSGSSEVVPKQIGAPASDLLNGRLRAPDPSEIGRPFGHAMIPIQLDDTGAWSTVLPVPPTRHLAIMPIGPGCDRWSVTITDPVGLQDGPDWLSHEGDLQPFFPQLATRFDLPEPTPGDWTIEVDGGQPGASGYLVVRDHSGVALQVHPTSHVALVGHPITLRAALAEVDTSGSALDNAISGVASGLDVVNATIQWQGANGTRESLEVQQRGPWLESTFTPQATGHQACHFQVQGVDADGFRFIRSGTYHFHVDQEVSILGVDTHELDDHRLAIDLKVDDRDHRTKFLLGAEVWGEGSGGLQPRCWIGGMTRPDQGHVRLILDRRWLTVEGATGQNVELRAVRVASPGNVQPLLASGSLPTISLGDLAIPGSVDLDPASIQAMHRGRGDQPGWIGMESGNQAINRADQYGGHNLILSHGYCSDADSWPESDFSGDVSMYINTYQNFTHDEFAMDIWYHGGQYKSYGIAGHSQGGNAALHLYAFYWSGMDWASDGRLVQALGTPFTGTSLAGDISILGELFGFGCGVNSDMTYDGAAQWLSYVPTVARQETWTWTSTFEDDWWSYDYCHILTDLILWDPEDGVVENSEGDLDGGNNMGTTVGWCHIKNMSEPREVNDTNRTSEMDAEAAR